MRFPAVFTSLADIFLGFLLTHATLAPAGEFVLLAIGSSGLYLAGMVFNDFFDRDIDARERSGRPIPSGRITPRAAGYLGTALMLLGPITAAFVSLAAVEIALGLVVLVLAYDRFLKHTPVGPIAMGGCRFLNVMFGASAAASGTWANPQVVVALAMGVYVAGVTWFARQEAGQSARAQLSAAAALSHAAVIGLSAIVAFQVPDATAGTRWTTWAALALVTAWVDTRVLAAWREPSPRNVQAAVKQMLLAIVLFDATMVCFKTGDPVLAVGVALLFIPAATLGRFIFIT
jgi:4-hydroxybenzoate polyprenyltransferase